MSKEHHCCCCGGHEHENAAKHSHAHEEHSCCCGHNHDHKGGGCCGSGGGENFGIKLVLSAVSLVVSFAISLTESKIPFYPWTDPAWVAVFFCAGGIFKDAIADLRARKIGVAMLVSLAMIASFGLQILEAFGVDTGDAHCHSYIFVVAEISFLMQLGEWLEGRTVAKTRAGLERLVGLMPKTARVVRGDSIEEIPASEIAVGDIVEINPHEMISADGVVVEGSTTVNESNMTGESAPVEKLKGDSVLCGTFNESARIRIRAKSAGNETSLAKMVELVEEAEGTKSPITRAATKWAAYIVPCALVLSVVVFLVAKFALGATATEALVRGATILVVFCPCAFVLAAPTAISAGMGNASKNGVLVRSGEALEEFSKATEFFFDKTGTLTEDKMRVAKFETFAGNADEILLAAAAIETASKHPTAKAVVEYAKGAGITDLPSPENVREAVGEGISAEVNGKKYRIIKSAEKSDGQTASDVLENGVLAARISFAETVRASAREAVDSLKAQGCSVAILSGDKLGAVRAMAEKLGIENYRADLLPHQKLEAINAAKSGKTVCMVGDGVNDSPSLAAADVSVAVNAKNDIALNTAQIAILDSDLGKIAKMRTLSRSVLNTIYTNITISVLVNITSVLLALFGIITPVWGALIHNASSVGVVGNSARLLNSKALKK